MIVFDGMICWRVILSGVLGFFVFVWFCVGFGIGFWENG